ncbi:hypothetical protein ACOMHN_061277 [Nucella lapillus]
MVRKQMEEWEEGGRPVIIGFSTAEETSRVGGKLKEIGQNHPLLTFTPLLFPPLPIRCSVQITVGYTGGDWLD